MTHWTPGQPGSTPSTNTLGKGQLPLWEAGTGALHRAGAGPGPLWSPNSAPTRRPPERPPLSDGSLHFYPQRAQLRGGSLSPGTASHQRSACEGPGSEATQARGRRGPGPSRARRKPGSLPHHPLSDSSRKGPVWMQTRNMSPWQEEAGEKVLCPDLEWGAAARRPQPPPAPSLREGGPARATWPE